MERAVSANSKLYGVTGGWVLDGWLPPQVVSKLYSRLPGPAPENAEFWRTQLLLFLKTWLHSMKANAF